VLRRIFGTKRAKVTRGNRKLKNEERHRCHSSRSIIRMINSRRMRLTGHIARMEERKNACWLLVGKPESKRPLRRLCRRWVESKAIPVTGRALLPRNIICMILLLISVRR
jgi:hypothetical protein